MGKNTGWIQENGVAEECSCIQVLRGNAKPLLPARNGQQLPCVRDCACDPSMPF